MEFGKLTDISHVDFTLPPDDSRNVAALGKYAGSQEDFTFYFGSTRWGEKGLIGKIYPPKTAARDYLYYYSRQFSAIELNTTYYRIPTAAMVQEWCHKALPSFQFCPKVPQLISHARDFGHSLKATDQFLDALFAFGEQLGLPFMQLPPDYAPQQGRALFDYLRDWPKDMPLAVEFRHPGWFDNERIKNRAFDLLEATGIAAVITDTAGRRDVIHQSLTHKHTLIRFVGNSLHASDYQRIDDWVSRIKSWREAGLKQVYFIVHQPDEHLCIDLAIYLVEKMNADCNLQLTPPRLLPLGEQQSLF